MALNRELLSIIEVAVIFDAPLPLRSVNERTTVYGRAVV